MSMEKNVSEDNKKSIGRDKSISIDNYSTTNTSVNNSQGQLENNTEDSNLTINSQINSNDSGKSKKHVISKLKSKVQFKEEERTESINPKKKLCVTDFQVSQTLGRGAYAKVMLAEHKGKYYALKVIDKKFIEKYEKVHEVHTEKQILTSLNHRSIIKLHSTFQDSKALYFVLDYCPNKDLADFLRMNVILSKELAQFYAAEIVNALDYLRKNGLSHRDLKPENIMLDDQMKIKIVSY